MYVFSIGQLLLIWKTGTVVCYAPIPVPPIPWLSVEIWSGLKSSFQIYSVLHFEKINADIFPKPSLILTPISTNILRFEVLSMVTKKSTVFCNVTPWYKYGRRLLPFQRNILSPYSVLECKPSQQEAECFACLAYYLTLNIEAGHSFEMSVNFYTTTQHHKFF